MKTLKGNTSGAGGRRNLLSRPRRADECVVFMPRNRTGRRRNAQWGWDGILNCGLRISDCGVAEPARGSLHANPLRERWINRDRPSISGLRNPQSAIQSPQSDDGRSLLPAAGLRTFREISAAHCPRAFLRAAPSLGPCPRGARLQRGAPTRPTGTAPYPAMRAFGPVRIVRFTHIHRRPPHGFDGASQSHRFVGRGSCHNPTLSARLLPSSAAIPPAAYFCLSALGFASCA